MALIRNWLPPSRENWELAVFLFEIYPAITMFQWLISWYGAGKTSTVSIFNLPGKIAWIIMEVPGFIILLYIMNTLPAELNLTKLPWENWVMASIFTIHYLYRAIISPLINPSMSPIHILVIALGWLWQVLNALSIGGWLAGHGRTTSLQWTTSGWFGLSSSEINYKAGARMELGLMIWALAFVGVIWHDDELREIRRAAARKQAKLAMEADPSTGKGKAKGKGVDKVYVVPKNGLFWWTLHPHYLLEWIEWTGFWIMAGLGCVPARSFVVNEISTMLPRALQQRRWYVARFGEEKLEGRAAVIPGIL